jgi:Holliday junction resolvase-like predicted endonuclease
MGGPTSRAKGLTAEALATRRLDQAGWRILGHNVRAGRHELDIVAVDPGPPARLVAVEVRFRSRRDYGLPEETFDRRKRARTMAALLSIRSAGCLPDGTTVPSLPPAVDLIVVEPATRSGEGQRVRHHRDALA